MKQNTALILKDLIQNEAKSALWRT